jgi:Ras family protein
MLRIAASHDYNSRQVKPEEGQKLAKSNDAAWVETSAKNNINVGQCSCYTSERYQHPIQPGSSKPV